MVYYHYLSTAKSNYREYLKGETVRLKKYFYVLRPLLACKWILSEQTPPPMLFSELMDQYLEDEMKPTVQELLRLKMSTPEVGTGRRIDVLNNYIDGNIEAIEKTVQTLPIEEAQSWDMLNELFLSLINK